jgi:hypothetical protein
MLRKSRAETFRRGFSVNLLADIERMLTRHNAKLFLVVRELLLPAGAAEQLL